MSAPAILQEQPDFSLVLGGPLFQIFRQAHLSGSALELLRRRVLIISLFAWLPLAVLSAIEGHLLGSQNLTFLRDVELHVRFLVALPVLILAELPVHRRLRSVVKCFLERGVVTQEDTPKFYAALGDTMRARDSSWLEFALLVSAACDLVSISVACVQVESALAAHAPRPCWRNRLSWGD